jgi:hypothetical protein
LRVSAPIVTERSPRAQRLRRGLPFAGILAILAVYTLDTLALGPRGPWQTVDGLLPGPGLERDIVIDQQELRALLETPPDQKRALVVGSSRAQSFRPQLIRSELRHSVRFGRIAHGLIAPFEIDSLVDTALAIDTDVVVILLSEFDLNRPVFIAPPVSFGSFAAVRDLAQLGGPAFSYEHRLLLFRLSAACALNSYRYRDVLQRAFADKWRRFELGDPFPRPTRVSHPNQVEGGTPTPLSGADQKNLFSRLGQLFPGGYRSTFDQIRSVTRGPHADFQRGLVRRAVARLHAAGVAIVIVETPVHPLSVTLYDTSIRDDFVGFASQLVSEFGVVFVALEDSEPYVGEDFGDLVHLERGAPKLTRTIETAVAEVLRVDSPLRR